MYDSDYCNRCAKCYGVYLILKDLRQRAKKSFGTELKMELNKNGNKLHESNPLHRDTYFNLESKLRGESYFKWFMEYNKIALDSSWNKEAVEKILSQHLESNNLGSTPSEFGLLNVPGKWSKYKN